MTNFKLQKDILKQKLSNLFTRVPLRHVQFHSEALPQEVEDLLLRQAALLGHQSQHLRNAVLIESVLFFSLDQLLKNLEIRKAN